MACAVRTIVAVLGVGGAALGCTPEPAEPWPSVPQREMGSAALMTIGQPGPADMAFGSALVAYSNLLARAHAYDERHFAGAVAAAVDELASVLETMPAASAEPSLRAAALAMRKNQASVEKAESEQAAIEGTQRSLMLAATALLRLATSAYRDQPDVLARARELARAAAGIDPFRTPPDRAGVIDALNRAERLLAAMYVVNIAPPR